MKKDKRKFIKHNCFPRIAKTIASLIRKDLELPILSQEELSIWSCEFIHLRWPRNKKYQKMRQDISSEKLDYYGRRYLGALTFGELEEAGLFEEFIEASENEKEYEFYLKYRNHFREAKAA